MSAAERAELVGALRPVDAVVVFEDDTVDRLVGVLRPDVQAKGTDYTEATVPERAAVLAAGDGSPSQVIPRITRLTT